MPQEDFAKLGFAIDISNAKAAFTTIINRLAKLDEETTRVANRIGRQMAAAFDIKDPFDTSSLDRFIDHVEESTEKASGAIGDLTKKATSMTKEEAASSGAALARAIKDIRDRIEKAREAWGSPLKKDKDLLENARRQADAIAREYSERIGNLRLSPNVSAFASSLKEALDKMSREIEIVKGKAGDSVFFPTPKAKGTLGAAFEKDFPGTFSKLDAKQADPIVESIIALSRNVENKKLGELSGHLQNIRASYEGLTEIAKSTSISEFAESIERINTFEFKSEEVKKLIQQFVDLRAAVARQGDVKAEAMFNVSALEEDFKKNLMPALERMRQQAVELLTGVQQDGIRIPVTFETKDADAEAMVRRINDSVRKLRDKIKGGETDVKLPSMPIRFSYVEALVDLRKHLAGLSGEEIPVVKVKADVSLPADITKGKSRQAKAVTLPSPAITPISDQQIEEFRAATQTRLDSIAPLAVKADVAPTFTIKSEALASISKLSDELRRLSADVDALNKKQITLKPVEAKISDDALKIHAPVLGSISQKSVDDVMARCQSLLDKAALAIPAPVIAQPAADDLRYLHENLQLMLDNLPRLMVKSPGITKADPEALSLYARALQTALMDRARLVVPSPDIQNVPGVKVDAFLRDVRQKLDSRAKVKIGTELRNVLNESISSVVADANKRLARHKIRTASPTIPFVANEGINAVMADLKERLSKRNVEVPVLNVSLAIEEIIQKKDRIAAAFGELPREMPIVKVDEKDLDSMQTYAHNIRNVADALRDLKGVQITLSPLMTGGAMGAENLIPLGAQLGELHAKREEITKRIGEMTKELMDKMAELETLDKKKPADQGYIRAITKDIRGLKKQIDLASAAKRNLDKQIEEQAKAAFIPAEQMVADAKKSAGAIFSDVAREAQKARADATKIGDDALSGASDDAKKRIDETTKSVGKITEALKKYREESDKDTPLTLNKEHYKESLDEQRKATDDMWARMKADTSRHLVMNPDALVDPLKKMRGELKLTNNSFIDMARSMGVYLSSRTIVNYFRKATDSAMEFGYEIRKIQSLALNFDFGKLYSGLMDLDTRFGNVTQNARALYWAYSSGIRGTEKDLVKFTEIMSKTAITINAEVMPTVDAATAIMNAYGLSAGRAAEVADLMFTIVKEGKASAQELTSSFGNIIATASALGVSLDDLGAAAATLTKTMRTNKAFTYLNNIMGKMVQPTKEISDYAATLGVEFSASAVKAKGFANVMRELHEATGGNIGKIAKLFPDLRGQRAALTLLSTQYSDFMRQVENFENKAGNMEEGLGKITDSPEAHFRALKDAMAMLSIEAGNAAHRFVTLGGAMQKPIEFLNGLKSGGKKIAGNWIASTAALGGMVMAQKAFAMASFASAQANTMVNLATLDGAKAKVQTAVYTRQQIAEQAELNLKMKEQQRIDAENKDEGLRRINISLEANKVELNKLKVLEAQLKTQRKLSDAKIEELVAGKAPGIDEERMHLATLQVAAAKIKADDKILAAKDAQTLAILTSKAHNAQMAEIRKKELEAGIKYTREQDTYFKLAGSAKFEMGRLDKGTDEYERVQALYDEYSKKAFGTKWAKMSEEDLAVMRERLEAAEFQAKATAEAIKSATGQRLSPEALAFEQLDNVINLKKQEIQLSLQQVALNKDLIKDEQVKANLEQEVASSQALLSQAGIVQTLERQKLQAEARLGIPEQDARIQSERAAVNVLKAEVKKLQSDMESIATTAELEVKNATVQGGRAGKKATDEAMRRMDEFVKKTEEANKRYKFQADDSLNAESKAVQLLRERIAHTDKNISMNEKMLGNDEKSVVIQQEINNLIKERKALETEILNKQGQGVWAAGKAAYAQGGSGGAMMATQTLMRVGGFMSGPAGMVASMLPVNKMLAGSVGMLNASMMKAASNFRTVNILMKMNSLSAAGLSTKLGSQSLVTLFSAGAAQKLAVSEAQLAMMRTATLVTAGVATGVIGALAVGLGALLHMGNSTLFYDLADSMEGVKKAKERGSALDEYMYAIKERSGRSREIEQSMESYIASSSKEIQLLQERINELRNAEGKQEELNRAMEKLNAAMFGKDMMGDMQRRLHEAIRNMPSMSDDQGIKAAAEELRRRQENYSKYGMGYFFSDSGPMMQTIGEWMVKIGTLGIAPAINYWGFEKGINEAQNSLAGLQAAFKENQEIAIGALQAPVQSLISLASLHESITDAYIQDKTAEEQLAIQRSRLEMIEKNRIRLFGADKEITNVYYEYLEEERRQNDNINLIHAELTSLIEKRANMFFDDNGKKEMDKQIEEAEKRLDDAQQKNQKFTDDFAKATTSMIDQQMKVMEAINKRVEEANRQLNYEAKLRDFDKGTLTDEVEMTRLMGTVRNWEMNRDSPVKEIEKTAAQIDETKNAINWLQERLKERAEGAEDIDKIKRKITGHTMRLEELNGLRRSQENDLKKHDEQYLDSRINLANYFAKMVDKLKQNQENLHKNLSGLDNELWDRIMAAPSKMFETMRKNNFSAGAGDSVADLIKNRVKSLEQDRAQDQLDSMHSMLQARQMTDEQRRTNEGIAQYVKNLNDAQVALDKAKDSWQMEIAIKRRLADAEKKANEEATKLANQLNEGFKSRTQKGFEAGSMEAFELQTREWERTFLPKVSTTKQDEADASWLKMIEHYNKTSTEISEALKVSSASINEAANKLNVDNSKALAESSKKLDEAATKFSRVADKMSGVSVVYAN